MTRDDLVKSAWPVVAFAAIAVITGLLLSQNVLFPILLVSEGVFLLLWLAACAGVGSWILGALTNSHSDTRTSSRVNGILHWVSALALGIGTISSITHFLGLAGLLNRPAAWGMTAIGIVLLVMRLASSRGVSSSRELVRDSEGNREEKGEENANEFAAKRGASWNWLLLAVAPLFGMSLVGAFVPPGLLWGDEPHGYDVVSYHLQVPREWYEAGKITPLHHNAFSFMPMGVEMNSLLAMYLRGGPWAGMYLAQLMHLTLVWLTPVAVYGLLRDRGVAPAANGAVACAGVPWIAMLAPVAYNEGGLLLFGTLAIGWTLRAIWGGDVSRQSGERANWKSWILPGLFAGFACTCKLTAAPTMLIIVPICILMFRGETRVPRAMLNVLIYGVVATAIFSPWLIRNIVWADNPVFPEAMEIFGSGHFTPEQVERWRAAHSPTESQRSITGHAAALGKQILSDFRFGYALFPLGVLALISGGKNSSAWMLATLLAMSLIVWLMFTHLQGRFFVHAIPLAALLIGMNPWKKVFAPLVAIMAVVSTASVIVRYPQLPQLLQFAGTEDMSDLRPLQKDVPDNKTLALVGDACAFWYRTPMNRLVYRTVFDVDGRSSDTISAWLGENARRGDVILLIDPGELSRFAKTYRHIPAPSDELLRNGEPYLQR